MSCFLVPKLVVGMDDCLHGIFDPDLLTFFVFNAEREIVQRDISLIEFVSHGISTRLHYTVLSLRVTLPTLLSRSFRLVVHLERVPTATVQVSTVTLAILMLIVSLGLVAGGS